MAQKGIDLRIEDTVNVPANRLWTIIGPQYADIYKWNSKVDHSEGKGSGEFDGAACSERVCDVNAIGASKVKERIVNYDEGNMNLAFEILEGMPGFVTQAINDWTVVALNESQSRLIMKATIRSKGLMGTLMNGMVRRNMKKTLETVLHDAKVYVETGKISAAKQKSLERLSKKNKKAV